MAFGKLVMGASISAILGIISLIVYTLMYATLNTAMLDPSNVSMLGIIPTVLTVSIVVSVIMIGFGIFFGK